MKIDSYYRNTARISLNGSMAALIPAVLIIAGNLFYFQRTQIMLLTIPFLLYSIVNFQIYLKRVRQAVSIGSNLLRANRQYQSLFSSEHLVLFFYNTLKPRLALFFPDGFLAGVIQKAKCHEIENGKTSHTFVLYNYKEELVGFYVVHQKEQLNIKVYDQNKEYIGCLERTRQSRMRKAKNELLNAEGRFVAAVEGAILYMDEQVVNSYNHQVGRLRRGWMPLEWNSHFPEPNTPVFSPAKGLSNKDKLLQMSFLINEFFVKR